MEEGLRNRIHLEWKSQTVNQLQDGIHYHEEALTKFNQQTLEHKKSKC